MRFWPIVMGLVGGCASAPNPWNEPAPVAPIAPIQSAVFSSKPASLRDSTAAMHGLARGYANARMCAMDAAAHHRRNRDFGWSLMSACVARNDFFDLRGLLISPWVQEIQHRQVEGMRLLASVMTRTGSPLHLDLQLAHDAGLPMHSLNDLLRRDDVKGRFTLLRGKVVEKRTTDRASRLTIAELKLARQTYRDERLIRRLEDEIKRGDRHQYVRFRDRNKMHTVHQDTGRRVQGWFAGDQGETWMNRSHYFLVVGNRTYLDQKGDRHIIGLVVDAFPILEDIPDGAELSKVQRKAGQR